MKDVPNISPDSYSQAEVIALTEVLNHKSAEQTLEWAFEHFGDKIGMTTALGYSGIVLMDIARRINSKVEIFFFDSGHHFPETLELLDRVQKELKLEIKSIRYTIPDEMLEKYYGPDLFEQNPNLCCHFRKVEPLLKILPKKDAWLNALRRDQSSTRANIDSLEVDGRGVLKVYPLAFWSSEKCWEYIRQNKLPYNPLHDKGYPSIGCRPCTQRVKPGEHERAGRWNSIPKLECGLHLHK